MTPEQFTKNYQAISLYDRDLLGEIDEHMDREKRLIEWIEKCIAALQDSKETLKQVTDYLEKEP